MIQCRDCDRTYDNVDELRTHLDEDGRCHFFCERLDSHRLLGDYLFLFSQNGVFTLPNNDFDSDTDRIGFYYRP